MQQIILDTNFIMTCVKQKIDFVDEIPAMGYQILIPKEVIIELKKLKKDEKKQKSLKNRDLASLCLKIIKPLKTIKLNKTNHKKHLDNLIVNYIKENKNIGVATLDRELKKRLKNKTRILTIRGRKKLEFV